MIRITDHPPAPAPECPHCQALFDDNMRVRGRLKELALDVLAWWKVVFDTEFVHTKPGETPTQLAQRAREELDARGK